MRRADAISPMEMNVAIPTADGAVRVSASMAQVDDIVKKARRAMLGAALVALLVGSGLAFVAGQSIARPLSDLAGAARAIASGSLPRFPRSGIPDIDGLVQAVRQMHRQLDERFAQLKNEQSASAALVESMLEGVIAADGRGRITTANAAARRLLGYEAEHALPDVRQLFRSKSAREIVTAVLKGEAVQDRQLDLDGSTLLVNARPLDNEGAVLVLHDLTELRRLETVRRDFVANVSHELKTPLTSISGYAETLLSDSPDAATGREFLKIILSNAHRMQRLVDDLLDLSRIESGRWQPRVETVDVTGAAREVWASLAERAAARGTRFELKVDPVGDDARGRSRCGAPGADQPDRQLAALRRDGGRGDLHVAGAGRRHRTERARQRGRDHVGSPAPDLRAVLPGRHVALAGGGRHRTRALDREAPRRSARWTGLGGKRAGRGDGDTGVVSGRGEDRDRVRVTETA